MLSSKAISKQTHSKKMHVNYLNKRTNDVTGYAFDSASIWK